VTAKHLLIGAYIYQDWRW